MRYWFCNGLIEERSADGRSLNYSVCARRLECAEIDLADEDLSAWSYTCPVHGTVTMLEDGSINGDLSQTLMRRL
jgi:hypothetical protein